MNGHFIATLLAARRLVAVTRPDLLEWAETQWALWLSAERRLGATQSTTPRLIVVAALTCLEDLSLHFGLMQLLSFPQVRLRLVLTFPSAEAVAIAAAQALRDEWANLVTIRADEDWRQQSSKLPAQQPVVIFPVPAPLSQEDLDAISAILRPPSRGTRTASSQTGKSFQGRIKDYSHWSQSAQEAPALSLARLVAFKPPEMPTSEDSSIKERVDHARDAWSPEVAGGALLLSRLGERDEFVLRTLNDAATDRTVVRIGGELHQGALHIPMRLPPTFSTVEPKRIGLQLACGEGSPCHVEMSIHVPPKDLQPWMLAAFLNRGGAGNRVMEAFASGAGCRIGYAEDEKSILREVPVVWGVLRGSKRILEQANRQGMYFFYVDHAYFARGHGGNYRITRNGYEAGRVRIWPRDRLETLGLEPLPWRRGGRDIVVCPPTESFMNAHGCTDWLDTTLAELSHLTDRPVIVRKKPEPGDGTTPLAETLVKAHALVTHSSNVAVEAVCLGTPVFVSETSAAAPVARTDLSLIEDPVYPDRTAWLAHLAYCQFSLEEINRGFAWQLLRETEVRDFA